MRKIVVLLVLWVPVVFAKESFWQIINRLEKKDSAAISLAETIFEEEKNINHKIYLASLLILQDSAQLSGNKSYYLQYILKNGRNLPHAKEVKLRYQLSQELFNGNQFNLAKNKMDYLLSIIKESDFEYYLAYYLWGWIEINLNNFSPVLSRWTTLSQEKNNTLSDLYLADLAKIFGEAVYDESKLAAKEIAIIDALLQKKLSSKEYFRAFKKGQERNRVELKNLLKIKETISTTPYLAAFKEFIQNQKGSCPLADNGTYFPQKNLNLDQELLSEFFEEIKKCLPHLSKMTEERKNFLNTLAQKISSGEAWELTRLQLLNATSNWKELCSLAHSFLTDSKNGENIQAFYPYLINSCEKIASELSSEIKNKIVDDLLLYGQALSKKKDQSIFDLLIKTNVFNYAIKSNLEKKSDLSFILINNHYQKLSDQPYFISLLKTFNKINQDHRDLIIHNLRILAGRDDDQDLISALNILLETKFKHPYLAILTKRLPQFTKTAQLLSNFSDLDDNKDLNSYFLAKEKTIFLAILIEQHKWQQIINLAPQLKKEITSEENWIVDALASAILENKNEKTSCLSLRIFKDQTQSCWNNFLFNGLQKYKESFTRGQLLINKTTLLKIPHTFNFLQKFQKDIFKVNKQPNLQKMLLELYGELLGLTTKHVVTIKELDNTQKELLFKEIDRLKIKVEDGNKS